MPSVVCKGDVEAKVVGDFSASPVAEVTVSKLAVGGAPLVSSAKATFTNTSSGATTPVMWEAKPGKLKVGGENTLLEGTSGPIAANHLASSTSNKLHVAS